MSEEIDIVNVELELISKEMEKVLREEGEAYCKLRKLKDARIILQNRRYQLNDRYDMLMAKEESNG